MTELLTVGDVAKRMGVTPATVRVWADLGRIEVQRTASGVRLFAREHVERFARARIETQEAGTHSNARAIA